MTSILRGSDHRSRWMTCMTLNSRIYRQCCLTFRPFSHGPAKSKEQKTGLFTEHIKPGVSSNCQNQNPQHTEDRTLLDTIKNEGGITHANFHLYWLDLSVSPRQILGYFSTFPVRNDAPPLHVLRDNVATVPNFVLRWKTKFPVARLKCGQKFFNP